MKAELLKETIKALYQVRRTVCIEGAPGGGKTSIVEQAAREMGIECRMLHMPTMLVEDFGILFPCADGNQLCYKLPDWFPEEGKAPDNGILLFDDRNQATPDIQKVLANLCQSRTLHGHRLPEGWQVIATGNRQEDRAGANRILSHLRNRETVLSLDSDHESWTRWAMANGVKSEVIAFIQFRPNLLHDFKPERMANPSPRSWVQGVSDIIGIVPKAAERACFDGAIGEGASTEFSAFLKMYRELPNIDDCITDPDNAPVPQKTDVRYAVTVALVERTDKDNIESIGRYMDRLAGSDHVEFMILYLRLVKRKNNSLKDTKAFGQRARALIDYLV